jgi:alpha-mannosidase
MAFCMSSNQQRREHSLNLANPAPNSMKTTLIAALAIASFAFNLHAAESRVLWHIGEHDGNNTEFALAPGDYSKFQQDGFFVVGAGNPKQDWPYVHPGPSDAWAGGREHTFTILFGVKSAATAGNCRLLIDLLDAQKGGPPRLRITVNGTKFEKQTASGNGDDSIQGTPAKGKAQRIAGEFPASLLQAGANQIELTTVSGSWLLYDSVALETPPGIESAPVTQTALLRSVEPVPALMERDGKLLQPIKASLVYFGEPQSGTLKLNGQDVGQVQLVKGRPEVEILTPAVEKETAAELSVVAGGKTLASAPVKLTPVRKWVVYILMHSHTDIGYTDIQPNIEKKQAHNVVQALELIRQTKDYPVGARFKWNLEVMWAADQFFRIATPEQVREFEQAVHDGNIGVDALYGNLLTGLCRSEEMMRQISFGTDLGRRCGVTVDSMMISDVPGLTWGLVPALAQHGVKYISAGPNASRTMAGDRIGYVRVQYENNPFYWESPSGKERALYWGSQGGYSFGHHFSSLTEGLPFLLQRLDEQGYAYDIVQLRWTKGDNGPPDVGVMPAVRDWNKKYTYPKLIIATTSEAFHAFEQKYSSQLPTHRGDMTPYWEDGAPSSARETALNRHSADRLVQAETIWALRSPGKFPADRFAVAWKNAALYSEHTWGAHNSISQPDLPFVKTQWKYKQGYALDADKESRALLEQALGGTVSATTSAVDVFNTASWPRTDLVTLPKETKGDLVKDERGQPVPSQRLSTGELVFLARNVSPFGASRFHIEPGSPAPGSKAAADNLTLTTPSLTVKLDPATGDIVSLRATGVETEFADGHVNNYIYLPGADTNNAQPSGAAKITVKETGPLVASLLVESPAPGCNRLAREVRLVDGLDRVELIDLLDKKPVRTVEGVHRGFSFNIPDPIVHINSPGVIGEPEKDQLPGACKNWFCVERWVDISNSRNGVTWVTDDAPLMELGGLTANLPRSQPDPNAYLKTIKPSSKIYAWVMNNHWHTNYRADQEGPTWFRFTIRPHAAYDSAAATRFGVESTEPLLVAPATGPAPLASRLSLDPDTVILTAFKPSDDGKALIIRLWNPTDHPQTARLNWKQPVQHVWLSSAREEQGAAAPESISLAKFDLATLRVEQ